MGEGDEPSLFFNMGELMVTRKEISSRAHSWIESFGMKLLARFIMPILISSIGFLLADVLQNINQSITSLRSENSTAIANLWTTQRATAQALSATTSRLEVLYERVDQNKLRMEDSNKRQSDSIDGLTHRLDTITAVPATPKH